MASTSKETNFDEIVAGVSSNKERRKRTNNNGIATKPLRKTSKPVEYPQERFSNATDANNSQNHQEIPFSPSYRRRGRGSGRGRDYRNRRHRRQGGIYEPWNLESRISCLTCGKEGHFMSAYRFRIYDKRSRQLPMKYTSERGRRGAPSH